MSETVVADPEAKRLTCRLSGQDSAGTFTVIEAIMAPRSLITPHAHAHEDELCFLIEGALEVRIGDAMMCHAAGTCVFKPRGVPHTHWNTSDAPARVLEVYSPAGLDALLDAGGAFFVPFIGRQRPTAVDDLATGHGLSALWFNWIPQLKARYPELELPQGLHDAAQERHHTTEEHR